MSENYGLKTNLNIMPYPPKSNGRAQPSDTSTHDSDLQASLCCHDAKRWLEKGGYRGITLQTVEAQNSSVAAARTIRESLVRPVCSEVRSGSGVRWNEEEVC
jgi:hypothetical protein